MAAPLLIPGRGVYDPRNRLNDLTGREWVFSTRSVWNKAYPPSFEHALRSQHGGQKPPELCRDLICTFTKSGASVLDPFMGVGGTLLGAALCGRQAVGVEKRLRWIGVYREVCRRAGLPAMPAIAGDSRRVLPALRGEGRFDLLLTDVPYWDMDKARRSKGLFKRHGEEARAPRRSKLRAFDPEPPLPREAWRALLRAVFQAALPLLKPRAYVVVFAGDMYKGGRFYPVSHDVAGELEALGLTWKADLVWYDVSKKLHLYGYRYEFIPSMVHQSILVFRT